MMRFEPIAIVGQSCTLPGALNPRQLWENVLAGRSSVGPVPAGRWGLSHGHAMGTVANAKDRTWSDAGGYVTGFDAIFDPTGFSLGADDIRALDPVFQMTFHGVREALRDALPSGSTGESASANLGTTGLILGNLSFPSAAMALYAESVWADAQRSGVKGASPGFSQLKRPHARNRFHSGLPAHLAAKALGLGGPTMALDAACASSLYAIKLACDALHDRRADVMVAGAVNQADDLFIHVGFCALSAMSKSGQSRPFHRDADGLVPAEGAAFVVLQRLSDAIAGGRTVLGVIRGVGLSNDGRGRGLLAPSEEGQERALRQAYAQAGLNPHDMGLLECHATGTPVGDATEVRSMARVFAGCEGVPMGSLKSNLGHLITTAGVAGLLKVLAAIKHEIRPKTLHADAPIDALAGTPFRLLAANEEWRGPRRAAVSAFGFGGNNAHLIVESLIETTGYVASAARAPSPPAAPSATPRTDPTQPCPIAIVGIGARVGNGDSARDFAASLFAGTGTLAPRDTLAVDLEGLKFPPTDLQQTLAQQTMVLEAAREAAHNVRLPRDTTSVLIGMGCDAEVARYGARWRLATRADAASSEVVAPDWLQTARDSIVPVLQSAGVLGTMPNIPANRITSQLDLAGPAFTVSSEEGSGISALWIAARALRAGEIDAALVGAVDMSHEPVHITALAELGLTASPGDAAVVLTLKRLSDAERDGDPVYATMGTGCDFPVGYGDSAKSASDSIQSQRAVSVLRFGDGAGALNLEETFGKAHAAHGLLHVAAAALALRHRARPAAGHPANPCLGAVAAHVDVSVMDAPRAHVYLSGVEPAPWSATDPGRLHIYSGKNQAAVLQALADGRESPGGPARLVLVAAGESERTDRAELARRWLLGGGPVPEGVAFREAPIGGQVAFVFTGAAAAYPGMGRDLALALPAQVRAVSARCSEAKSATDWIYGPGDGLPTHPLDQLWGTSFLCQLHAEVTRQVLRISPHATIGYSSGESNALFAMGAWNDLGEMMRESRGGTAFTSDLCGEFNAPRRAWERLGRSGSTWVNYIVAAPVAIVREALADEPLAHITIINTSDDCVIGGESEACARALERIGTHRALPLGYAMAAHCPEVEEISAAWWKLHHRDTRDVPGVRFYTNATNTWFRPTSKLAADAITGQALRTLDFTKTVEAAWNDGVRVFIEHGPRGLCSGWIRQILEGKEHLVVPLDVTGRSGVRQLMNAAAWLAAGGVDADVNALTEALSQGHTAPRTIRVPLLLNAHAPAPHVPPLPPFPLPTSQLNTNHTARTTPASLTAAHLPKTAMQHMIPAPPLESVLHPVNSR